MFSGDHTVNEVTYCVKKMRTACSVPMVGLYFDAMIAALSYKEWL